MAAIRNISESQLSGEYIGLISGMRQRAEITTSEPVSDAFFAVLPDVLEQFPDAHDLFYKYVGGEQVDNNAYRRRKIFACTQALVISNYARIEFGYPEKFGNYETMHDFLSMTFSDANSPLYQKMQRLLGKDLPTNRPQRAIIPAVVAAGLRARHSFDGNIVCSEWGASGNHLLKAWALRKFMDIVLLDQNGVPDVAEAKWFNFTARTIPLYWGIGIEKSPPRTTEDRDLLKSASLRPSHLDFYIKNGFHEENYDVITEIEVANVSTMHGDFFNLRERDRARLMNKPANIASVSFVLGQNKHRAKELLGIIRPTMAYGGKILVTDRVSVDPKNPKKIIHSDNWDDDWSTKTLMIDASHPKQAIKTVMEWKNGDCEVGRRGPDYSALGLPAA